jgi:diguanylate cyclase (GGDEF)-like protein
VQDIHKKCRRRKIIACFDRGSGGVLMRFSLKIFFLISMVLLGIACAIAAGIAEQLLNLPYLEGFLSFVIVGSVFGLINFLLVLALFPRGSHQEEPGTKMQDPLTKKDPLTGLLSRKTFDMDTANISGPLYSIIIMDVDNFKAFKEEYGNHGADSLLQKIGKAAKANIRSNDRVYSYQGDVFAVLLANCDKDQAIKIAEKIRIQVSKIDNSPFPGATVSVAVVSFPQDGDNTRELLLVAEELLQSAKKSGKNSTFALARGKIS